MKNDQIYVGQSKISGEGVFAKKDFIKGEVVLHWDTTNLLTDEEFKKLPENEKDYISFVDNKYVVMQEPERYVNHSCEPNTTAINYCDVAIKDIKKDEEITEDYSSSLAPGEKMECRCGSPVCRKIIKNR